jgi:hypothetical protein
MLSATVAQQGADVQCHGTTSQTLRTGYTQSELVMIRYTAQDSRENTSELLLDLLARILAADSYSVRRSVCEQGSHACRGESSSSRSAARRDRCHTTSLSNCERVSPS